MHPAPVTLLVLFCTSFTPALSLDDVTSTDIIIHQRLSSCAATDLCSDLVCSYSGINVTLSVDKLREMNVDIEKIHLRDRRCTGFPIDDQKVYIRWSLGEGICGTEFIVSPTHATYKNYVYLPPDPAAIIYREAYILNITCTYPLHLNVSLPSVLWPDLSITYIGFENIGQFKVKMAIYKDISYTTPYNDSVVALSTKSNVYVGVFIEDSIFDFSLLMINCYSTPTNNIYDPIKYNIIINSCPNQKDATIKVIENGISSQGKFYIQMFKFIGDYSYVYLHCGVSLCQGSCAPTCSGRISSSDIPKAQGSLTIGPIRVSDFETDSAGKSTGFRLVTIIGLALMKMVFV